MNKNILAIAIAAAVAAPSAFAASTVYGVAHMSVDHVMGTATANGGLKGDQTNISSNQSRLGIKGSEDLGNGLKAVYQWETTVAFDGEGDANSGFTGQRNTFVGLNGGFGTVLLGKHDTPLKMLGRKYELFGDQIGDLRSLTTADGNGVLGLGWDARPDNTVSYVTPNMNGFNAMATYVASENHSKANNNKDKDAFSVKMGYSANNLDVDAAYETHGKGHAGKSTSAFRLGAGYNFGSAKVMGFYYNQDYFNGTSFKERNIFGLGGAVKVGAAGTVKAQVAHSDNVSGIKKSEATLWAVGYDHALSKNTTVYGAYAYMDNGAKGFGNVNGTFHSTDATGVAVKNDKSVDNSAISVGLIHKF